MILKNDKKKKLEELFEIVPNNESVKFLYKRMLRNDYRGLHLLQHNRWTFEKFKAIIVAIFYTQDENGYIKIPRGDEGNSFNIGNYPQYNKLVTIFRDEMKKNTSKLQGTPNTIKKNSFPDLSRMNIIERYYKNKENKIIKLETWKKSKAVDFIRLKTEVTEEKIKDDLFLRELFFNASKNIYNNMYSNIINLLFELISDEELKGKITDTEFQFFVTWCDHINQEEIKKLILSWRSMNVVARKSIYQFLKQWANRKNFSKQLPKISKTQKRDFENWKNETQEIMQHIKNSELFALNETATEFEIVFQEQNQQIKRYRSGTSKLEYLKYHNIEKQKGFEFDHIVPFSWSTTFDQALQICSWKNLIYIDGKSHAIKSQSNNIYVYLNYRKEINYLYLESENSNDFLSLKLNENVLFNMNLFKELKEYNIKLIKFIS